MSTVVQHIISSFPDYSIQSKPRPDGFLLEFSSRDTEIEFRRVLPKRFASETDSEAFIRSTAAQAALFGAVRQGSGPCDRALFFVVRAAS